jgi:hypothetical protein
VELPNIIELERAGDYDKSLLSAVDMSNLNRSAKAGTAGGENGYQQQIKQAATKHGAPLEAADAIDPTDASTPNEAEDDFRAAGQSGGLSDHTRPLLGR